MLVDGASLFLNRVLYEHSHFIFVHTCKEAITAPTKLYNHGCIYSIVSHILRQYIIYIIAIGNGTEYYSQSVLITIQDIPVSVNYVSNHNY